MNYQKLLPAVLIFGAFLLTGVLIGRWLGHSFEAEQFEASGNQLPLMMDLDNVYAPDQHSDAPLPSASAQKRNTVQEDRPRHKQRNVLLIGVSDLADSSPTLESVWLILYIPDLPQVTWMPIYPHILFSDTGFHIEAIATLRDAFMIENGSHPTQEFLNALTQEGIWWSNYVIFDKAAAVDLIDSLGGLETISSNNSPVVQKSNGEEAFAGMRSTTTNIQGALFSQANLIQQLCRIPPKSYLNLNRARKMYQNMQNHIITDITPDQIVDDLQTMLTHGGGFVCDFPSLDMLSSSK